MANENENDIVVQLLLSLLLVVRDDANEKRHNNDQSQYSEHLQTQSDPTFDSRQMPYRFAQQNKNDFYKKWMMQEKRSL